MSIYSILYDYQAFDMQRFGGISRYFCEIIHRLNSKRDIAVRFSINYYLTSWHMGKHRIPIPRFLYRHYKKYCQQKNLELTIHLLKNKKNYIFHPTYYDTYFLDYIGNHPFVITVHDMIHEKFPECFSDAELIIKQKREVITRANRIIAISENTKKDIIELLQIDPLKIDIIYHGTSMKSFSGKYNLKLPKRFLLFVGDRAPYKNFNRFIKAFTLLQKEDPELFLVCTGMNIRLIEKRMLTNLGIFEKIIHIKASDKKLSELYSRALAFVYPSLYEGFGIPILEAFACHCPVVLSNTSCFPEIAGDAGAYFDPYSEDSMFKAIKSVIYNAQERQELINRGDKRLNIYSWEKAAQATEVVYKKVQDSNS